MGTSSPKDVNIVILGGGFGGVYSALHLRKALKKRTNVFVTLVSRENFFLFTPFLHEVATGGIETRHIAYPIRSIRGWNNFRFIHAGVSSIDLMQKKVLLEHGSLSYDYLVLAVGGVPDTTKLPVAAQGVFTLKTLRDGMLLRNHLIRTLEAADAQPDPEAQKSLLTFVVVGGGSTGVQVVTEMRDFLHRFLLKNYPRVKPSQVRVLLVQDKNYVLEGMDSRLGDYALKSLQCKGIDVRLKSGVTGIGTDYVTLADQEKIETSTVIWAAGMRANTLVAGLPVRADNIGRVVVDANLEVPGFNGVYAVGDIAHFDDKRWEGGLPPRAHIAVRQAKAAAANVVADIEGRSKRPYRYFHMGETVSLGSHTAAMNVFGVRVYGLAARFIWLNGYLSLLMGRYNRIRVLGDWFWGLIFGRDITLLDI